jgi:hypothetical protein
MLSSQVSDTNNRRIQRVALGLPARVESKVSQAVSWNEITRLNDVSAFGAGFTLPRPVKRGRLVYMTIPLPRQLRCYDYMEPQYRIWGLVRRCIQLKQATASDKGNYAIGVAFIGKHPPSSYMDDPAKLYEIKTQQNGADSLWNITEAPAIPDETDLPKECRRHSRFQIPVSISVETIDEEGLPTASEVTVTENVSLGGASLFTTLDAEVGSFVRVKSEQYDVSIISIVRGKRLGKDGIPRLHIEFIDRFFPLDGIE